MWTSSKTLWGTVALLATVCAALPALSGVVGTDSGKLGKPASGGYTLRCWQDGRLILEEQHVSLPPVVDAASTRLQVIDRNQQPIVVAETKNATCLVKARPAERPRSLLP